MNSTVKRMAAVLLILTMAALCAACGGSGGQKKTGDVQQIYDDIAAHAQLPAMMPVGGDLVLDYYGIDLDDCEEALFMVYDGDQMLADEIVLIRAKDAAAAKAIKERLDARMQYKADENDGYLPEQYEVVKKGKVLQDGLRLALFVSPDIDTVLEVYNQYG